MQRSTLLISLVLAGSCAHFHKKTNRQVAAAQQPPSTNVTNARYLPLFQLTDDFDKMQLHLILLSTPQILASDGTATAVCIGEKLVLTAAHVVPLDNNSNPTTTDSEVAFFRLRANGAMIEEVRRVKVHLLKFNPQYDLALYEITDPSIRCRPVTISEVAPNSHDQYNRFGFNDGWKWTYGTYLRKEKIKTNEQVGEYDVYSMPSAPGMSGGPIFTGSGELVGLAVVISNSLSLEVDDIGRLKIGQERTVGSVQYEQLKEFLKDVQ